MCVCWKSIKCFLPCVRGFQKVFWGSRLFVHSMSFVAYLFPGLFLFPPFSLSFPDHFIRREFSGSFLLVLPLVLCRWNHRSCLRRRRIPRMPTCCPIGSCMVPGVPRVQPGSWYPTSRRWRLKWRSWLPSGTIVMVWSFLEDWRSHWALGSISTSNQWNRWTFDRGSHRRWPVGRCRNKFLRTKVFFPDVFRYI